MVSRPRWSYTMGFLLARVPGLVSVGVVSLPAQAAGTAAARVLVGRRSPLRSAAALLAAAAVAMLTGCITVPVGDGQPGASDGPTAPLTYADRLKATPVNAPTGDSGATELPQFVTDSRSIACVFTSSRAGNLNQPWEPNNFPDQANAAAPLVPVVNCQMARYPQVQAGARHEDCAGTNIGFLGGTALLTPYAATYGACRAGVTAVEAAFGPRGIVNQVMGAIPVLPPGSAIEAQGYRCAPMDDGVACANLASGVGFFVAEGKYELFGAVPAPDASQPAAPGATAG
ncbi:hypothetical protein AAGW05_02715 [Arthrobacter sp. LAPM80]|uniref:hypothetical protein n=1 Tax=Arthrobacter sp. LAPM80 TaxID=3141788 RepID=UPI00398A93A2